MDANNNKKVFWRNRFSFQNLRVHLLLDEIYNSSKWVRILMDKKGPIKNLMSLFKIWIFLKMYKGYGFTHEYSSPKLILYVSKDSLKLPFSYLNWMSWVAPSLHVVFFKKYISKTDTPKQKREITRLKPGLVLVFRVGCVNIFASLQDLALDWRILDHTCKNSRSWLASCGAVRALRSLESC